MHSTYVGLSDEASYRSRDWILRPLLILFVALVLLPYVKIIPTNTDTQPNAFLLACLLLAISFRGQKFPKSILWLWLLPPLALVIFGVEASRTSDLTNSTRSLYNYLALPIIATAVAVDGRAIRRFLFPLMNVINLVYFVVGLAQLVTGQQFVADFVGGGFRVDRYDFAYRGAVGLAPEPTAYATVMFLFIVVYAILGKEKSWWAGLSFLQILFFTRSTAVIFFIVAVLGIRSLIARRFKAFLFGTLCVLVLAVAVLTLQHFSESRVRSLTLQLVNDPARILDSDYSVLSRAGHAWYGCIGMLHNYGVPNGFSTFSDYYNDKIAAVDWLQPRAKAGIRLSRENRTLSGLGSVLFELGLLGLIVPITLWRLVRLRYGTVFSADAVTAALGIGLVALASGVPIGFPPLVLALGLLAGRGAKSDSRVVHWKVSQARILDYHQTESSLQAEWGSQ